MRDFVKAYGEYASINFSSNKNTFQESVKCSNKLHYLKASIAWWKYLKLFYFRLSFKKNTFIGS